MIQARWITRYAPILTLWKAGTTDGAQFPIAIQQDVHADPERWRWVMGWRTGTPTRTATEALEQAAQAAAAAIHGSAV